MILGREQPRVFAPPLRPLTPETTHGFAAIAFAEQVLRVSLFPWQRWLLLHALELLPDGRYRYRYVLVLVARQNGKTMVMLILALWHIYALDSRRVIATAQDLDTSESAWAEAVEWAQNDEELAALIDKIDLGHPKYLRLVSGCQYRVAAASRRGARGKSGDLTLLDELREHQTWDSWAAVTNTMNARPKAQAWAFSNAGDGLSLVLRFLRAQAHRRLGWPDGDADAELLDALDEEMEDHLAEAESQLGLFEWSAPPGARRNDPEAWAQANPSLNHVDVVENCVTERVIAAALATSPKAVFDAEVLCRWVAGIDSGPWPLDSWRETLDNDAAPADGTPRHVCVAMSWDRRRCYVARAGRDAEGRPIVGIAADQAGSDWVVPWLVEHRDTFAGVVVQSNGAPETSLIDEIAAAMTDDGSPANLTVIPWAGADLGSATGIMFDRLERRHIRHLSHPGLDAAAKSAAVKVLAQGSWVIDLAKSPTDAAPLKAAVGAVWAAETTATPAMPQVHEWPDESVISQWEEEAWA